MERRSKAEGFGYSNVEAEHGVSTVAFANGHGAGFRDEVCPPSDRWGEFLPTVRLGYEEGRKLRERDDMDGELPDYIVAIHYNGDVSRERPWPPNPSNRFRVRELYEVGATSWPVPLRIERRWHTDGKGERVYVATVVQGGSEFGGRGSTQEEAVHNAVKMWRRTRSLRQSPSPGMSPTMEGLLQQFEDEQG